MLTIQQIALNMLSDKTFDPLAPKVGWFRY